MEKQILKFLDYKLKIDKKEYALTYFKLRRRKKKTVDKYILRGKMFFIISPAVDSLLGTRCHR